MRNGDGALKNLRTDVAEPRSRLEDVVANWPTPTARDWKDTGDMTNVPENALLGRAVLNWSTPRSTDGEKGGPNMSFGAGGIPLPAQVSQWRTPTATDPKRGDGAEWVPDVKAGEHSLNRQAALWMNPRVSETGQYQYNKGNPDDPVQTLQGQAQASGLISSLPDQPISTVGEESSKIRRTLNPPFVEWLMGWPRGWTSAALTPPASNGCGCSATALCHYRQRMRSELFALGLPPEAQPVQNDLFA